MRVKNRVKQALKLLFNKDYINSRIMTCGACGSKNIIKIDNTLVEKKYETKNDIYNVYQEQSICIKCGAECVEIQYWTDPKIENMEVLNEFKRKVKKEK